MKFLEERRRFFIQSTGLFIFLLTSLIVVFYASGYSYKPEDRSVIKLSIIDFPFSFPSGMLFVDGKQTDQKFPQSIKLEPGLHNVRIINDLFYPWEKSVELAEDKVSLFEELYFVPKEIKDEFFAWNLKLNEIQLFKIEHGVFAVFDKKTLVIYIFDINRSEGKMLSNVINLPFKANEILACNNDSVLLRIKQNNLSIINVEDKTVKNIRLPSKIKDFRQDAELKELFPIKENPQSKPLLMIGKSIQQLSVENQNLYLKDEDDENKIKLFNIDGDFIESSEDFSYFAVISNSHLKIFSPHKWNEISAILD